MFPSLLNRIAATALEVADAMLAPLDEPSTAAGDRDGTACERRPAPRPAAEDCRAPQPHHLQPQPHHQQPHPHRRPLTSSRRRRPAPVAPAQPCTSPLPRPATASAHTPH